jgi:hypothetical protein
VEEEEEEEEVEVEVVVVTMEDKDGDGARRKLSVSNRGSNYSERLNLFREQINACSFELWSRLSLITADVEPYLIRMVTSDKSEDGLKSVCLDWEQIPCDAWNSQFGMQDDPFHFSHHDDL